MKKEDKITYQISSGNIFLDIGHPNPEEALAKSNLALQIYKTIKSRNLTQTQASKILGIDQPKISDIIRGNLAKYSIDRLMRFLRLLGNDIEIRIKKSKRIKRPKLEVIEGSSSSTCLSPKLKKLRLKNNQKI